MLMFRNWIRVAAGLLFLAGATGLAAAEGGAEPSVVPAEVVKPEGAKPAGPARVKIIPVREPIARPVLYVLRRGLKEAQAEGVGTVVIDMETPGGDLGTTLEIMAALDKFEGETIVYVNKEAISAGAIISSAADEIYFAPGGVIGAAAAVSGGGEEVAETMKQKINSYLSAKVRSLNAGKAYRADAVRAMMDADFEFKIGDVVVKPKGELLSLTADEAAKVYGEPPVPLFSAGTRDTLEDLLEKKFGRDGYTLTRLEVSWSEELASAINRIAPVLMGLGLLCVFIEFKTPGFGFFGITGGLLLALVFFGHHAAGLSGHEAALVFVLGAALVAVEVFLIPGTLVAGLAGATLMLGALVWSMLDVWPGEAPTLDADTLFQPVLNVALALAIALVGGAAVWRFLPKGWILSRIAVGGAPAGAAQAAGVAPERAGEIGSLIGREGVALTALTPSGQVEVDGARYEAQVAVGVVEAGARVRVVERKAFAVLVRPVE
jgi:membrane-bound serine protease (ClpP class)